ncbi:MAG: N-acyl homoserine lactonase family protein [Gemmatimonadota bacterium]|nr:N-acyl homoserine lactonase family protein [Gemmatimonadota bacterium]
MRGGPRHIVGFLALAAGCRSAPPAVPGGSQASYDVYAVRYGTLPNFPVRGLVAGADSARRMDVAAMVWLVRAPGRLVLVDAGFYRDSFMRRWKPADYVRPDSAIARLGVTPGDITDIIVTHVHWDHMDGIDLFPRARVWIQREEYDYYIGPGGLPAHPGVDSGDAAVLASLRARGRVTLVNGDRSEVIPGITLYTGGRHTFASQFAGVRTRAGTVVIASDNLYLYENLDRRRPIAQTFDSLSNLAAQDRMRRIASALRLIVPGHDPAVFERFPTPGHGVAKIE